MMKLALTPKEDPELPLLQRISSLELNAPQIAAQIKVTDTSTVQRLSKSGLHGRIAAKKPLKGHQSEEETCLDQETQTMDIRPVEICPLV